MISSRVIARLDIKPPFLIKPIGLDGVRKVGSPIEFTQRYLSNGIDELIYLDVVASLYGLSSTSQLVSSIASIADIPITVGGGIRTLDDVDLMMRSGADKIILNTAASENMSLISSVSNRYGSQAVVISLQARLVDSKVKLFKNAGRDLIGFELEEYLDKVTEHGAGEIMVTSIDYDGKMSGFDLELLNAVNACSKLPLIVSSGLSCASDLESLLDLFVPEGIAAGSCFHYNKLSVDDVKKVLSDYSVFVRSKS